MVGRTNYEPPTTAMPPNGPEQMVAIYEHFDRLLGETRPTVSDLPSSSAENWPNRTIMTLDTGVVWIRRQGNDGWDPLRGPLITAPLATGWSGQLRYQRVGNFVKGALNINRTGPSLNIPMWTSVPLATGLPPALFNNSMMMPQSNQYEYPAFQLTASTGGVVALQARWADRTFNQNPSGGSSWLEASFEYIAA